MKKEGKAAKILTLQRMNLIKYELNKWFSGHFPLYFEDLISLHLYSKTSKIKICICFSISQMQTPILEKC